jgi:hypothetical protein
MDDLARLAFVATLIEWRGPAPFVFAPIPEALVGEVRLAAHEASYGWGVVPVTATIGTTSFTTSLFPRDGGYLLPVKVAVQRAAAVGVGDRVAVELVIRARL